ncbi:hypothetical protein C1S99_26785 [Vibrio parahaemolyticus]|uniref:DUF6572 domain-containing protein n=1 Tax=Vibrio parahaemolyticus TaxID=670 RepID=UPI000C869B6D|nr:DUF6572 domain-containing protein [Vibrio parahaemolyticus]EJB8691841.1 hypothetical protein [Vibrio parahaemolyticus]EJH2591702.1 hypothetical protein [Vibrio parahaemolyticus]EJY0700865.1 hypothetical protein [Vibrio parahaemolyticus]MBE5136975.1 hypothetical protein [Vibrio parahaemolyticus]MDG2850050.1 hypothetical protein [Vibrio parahaemolyticus]
MRKNGVENSEHLDLISKDNSYVNLIIVQTNEFSPEQFSNFSSKINAYMEFVRNGQLLEMYPDLKAHKVRISIDMHVPVDDWALELFENTKQALSQYNVEFMWNELV